MVMAPRCCSRTLQSKCNRLVVCMLSSFSKICIYYWQEGAMMRDVILAIRADEAHHRIVNHTLSSMKQDEDNPHGPGQ